MKPESSTTQGGNSTGTDQGLGFIRVTTAPASFKTSTILNSLWAYCVGTNAAPSEQVMNTTVHASLLAAAARAATARVRDATIKSLRQQRSILAGEDSGFGTVWLEFCAQVQGEHSIDWDDFELHVRQEIEGQLFHLADVERQALWLQTPGGSDWLETSDSDATQAAVDFEEVVDSLFDRVSRVAADFEDERLARFLAGGEDVFEDRDEDDDVGGDEDQDA